jgi:hypothetical protein
VLFVSSIFIHLFVEDWLSDVADYDHAVIKVAIVRLIGHSLPLRRTANQTIENELHTRNEPGIPLVKFGW